jgi:3-isopropylmalate dehydrogenase
MTTYHIATLPGDGIGPEVTAEAIRVLQTLEPHLRNVRFEFQEYSVGAGEYLRTGNPMPPETFEAIKQHDAILLGAMGLPNVRWPTGTEMAPQLDLREQLDLYCGLRPIYLYNPEHSPLKSYGAGEIDFVIVRENTEGLFYSRKNFYTPGAVEVIDSLRISRHGAERLFRAAFREAKRRRNRVTLVDKSNVLPSMAYFRQIFDEVSSEFPEAQPEKIYIDAASLYLVQRPHTFDVIVTENLFGDILSDLAAGLVGGMGLAPSADIGDRHAVFQPSHGSAPDIAGKGIANPIATILSAAMMLEWLAHPETIAAAAAIRDAVKAVLGPGRPENRTRDLGGLLSTREMGDRVIAALPA